MNPMNPELDAQAEALAAMLDDLMQRGTGHVNLEIGEETRVQTVNSRDCGKPGACSVPNLGGDADEPI